MQVMVFVNALKAAEAGITPGQQLLTDMGNFNEQLVNAGIMLPGDGLIRRPTGVRVRFEA